MQYRHLRTFPFNFEICPSGRIRQQTSTGYIRYDNIEESNGTFVYLELNGKKVKCLVAELMLLSFKGDHIIGHKITYRDGNIHNVTLNNLKATPPKKTKKLTGLEREKYLIAVWRCNARATGANLRFAAMNQIISTGDVLKCLEIFEFKCFYCETELHPFSWHLDHFIPASKQGQNTFRNLRPSCKYCNVMKSDLIYEQLIQRADKIVSVYKKYYTFEHLKLTG